MAPPVLTDINEVGHFEVVAEASEALPALVTQDTGVVAVDDTKDAVTRWIAGQCFRSGGQSATAIQPPLMCATQPPARNGILGAAVSHALKVHHPGYTTTIPATW